MNVVSLLIKPASGHCNLTCDYCFYHDLAVHDQRLHHSFMDQNTMTHLLKQAYKYAPKALVISFQGGEPLLVGISFYEEVMAIINQIASVPTYLSIQTNGTLITKEWAMFFKKHQFLVGVSLDGPLPFHNQHRDHLHGSFNEVMQGIEWLKEYQVPFNVLCVITSTNVRHATTLYRFFKEQGLSYTQYIPVVPLYHQDTLTLSDDDYFVFLDELFTCWEQDILSSTPVSIRLFDNMVATLMGLPTNACDLNHACGHHLIVEANGDCYPCDFYVDKPHYLGNLHDEELINLINHTTIKEFRKQSSLTSTDCTKCAYHALCWGGCQKYRKSNHHYLYCGAMRRFFVKNIKRLNEIASMLHQ